MLQEDVTFNNSRKEILTGILRIPQSYEKNKFPAILVLHGYKENKGRDMIVALANHLTDIGFITLRFDFAGHGDSQGSLDDFGITNQVDDVVSAVRFLRGKDIVEKDMFGLVGHSWGGNIAIFVAAKYPLQSLVTIASRSSTDHFVSSHFRPEEVEELLQKGSIVMHDFKTISSNFLLDFRKFDMPKNIADITCPWLIFHGTDDKRAPYNEARELYYHKQDAKMDIVEMADHTFSGEHREYLLDTVGNWFKMTLKE